MHYFSPLAVPHVTETAILILRVNALTCFCLFLILILIKFSMSGRHMITLGSFAKKKLLRYSRHARNSLNELSNIWCVSVCLYFEWLCQLLKSYKPDRMIGHDCYCVSNGDHGKLKRDSAMKIRLNTLRSQAGRLTVLQ